MEPTTPANGHYAPVNGLQLYYEIHGEGYPLVLLHGGGSDTYTTFGRVLPLLVKSHKVIAVELQAHGHTADRGTPTSFEQDADDVAELLNQLNIKQANILGFSNGGTSAVQLVVRQPQLVNKLVIVSTLFKREGAHSWLWEFMKVASLEHMPVQLKRAFLSLHPDDHTGLQTMHDRDVERMRQFRDIPDEDIANIQVQTLIVLGDKDIIKPEHGVAMFHLIPNASLMILPGTHGECIGEIMSVNENEPVKYPAIDAINTFLRENPRHDQPDI